MTPHGRLRSSTKRNSRDEISASTKRVRGKAAVALVAVEEIQDSSGAVDDGTKNTNEKYLSSFPYLGTPNSGSKVVPGLSAT